MNKNAYVSEYGELSNGILLNVAEILALRLPEGTERVIAAKWVKKFLACEATEYKNNLSLFISCLTKQVLVEPFNKAPMEPRNQWQPFEREYCVTDINQAVKERIYKDAQAPPYKIEISQDLQEYVAFQEIPFFGAHFYYAFSPTEKINQWQNFEKLKVPSKYVKALKIPETPESPIKGMISKKPGDCISRRRNSLGPSRLIASKIKTPRQPQWEGPVEEEPESEPKPPRRTMISIPVDGPVRTIPPALQRRMAEAERQKQQRLAMKEEERAKRKQIDAGASTDRTKRPHLATPGRKKRAVATTAAPRKSDSESESEETGPSTSAVKTPRSKRSSSTSLRVKILKANASRMRDETIREEREGLSSDGEIQRRSVDQATSVEQSADPAYGPLTRLDSIKNFLNKSRLDNVVAPSVVTDNVDQSLNHVALTTPAPQEDRTNVYVVIADEVEQQETNTNALIEQANSIAQAAAEIDEDLRDLVLNVTVLDQTINKPVIAPETLRRLNQIKARASSLVSTSNVLSETQANVAAVNAECLLNSMQEIVNQASDANESLNNIQPESVEDQQVIQKLLRSNEKLIEEVELNVQPLIEAIENNADNLIPFTINISAELNQALNKSNETNDIIAGHAAPTSSVLEAIDIVCARDEILDIVAEDAADIEARSKRHALVISEVRRVLEMDNVDDDVIDLEAQDLEFEGGTVNDEEYLQESRTLNEQQRRRASRIQESINSLFNKIELEEDLNEVTEKFDMLLEESNEVINEVEEDLEAAQANAETQQEAQAIEEAKAKVDDLRKIFEKTHK